MKTPPISRQVEALPRIRSHKPVAEKINAALASEDRSVREASQACRGLGESQQRLFWERKVEITMSGPVLLSVTIFDSADCGGVHPFIDHYAVTYDLRTGEPVNWIALFPKGSAEEDKITIENGTHLVAIRSQQLQKLYSEEWRNREGCRLEDVVSSDELTPFLLFPDARTRKLQIFPTGLPEVSRTCADPVPLDQAAIASLGISETWQKILTGAGSSIPHHSF